MLVGKLVGAAKEMAIAWRYGVSATVDAYVFVFNLVNFPISVWFSVLSIVLIPVVTRLRNNSPAEPARFQAEATGLTVIMGTCLCLLLWQGIPVLLKEGRFNLTGQSLTEALSMAKALSLILPLGFLASLFSAWMMAEGRHRNTLLEGMPALVILFALLLPVGWIPEPLIFGTIAGFGAQLLALMWSLQRNDGLSGPSFRFQSPAWQGFLAGVGIIALGQVLASVTGLVDQFFAAGLSEGALSTLSYANRILALILGMGATAIGRATLPIFSLARTQGEKDVNALALKWARWMFLGGCVVAIIGAFASPFVVKLLFERGAFTPENTETVASVLCWSLIQVPFYFSALVLVSALGAGRNYLLIAFSGAANLLFKLVLANLMIERFKLLGLVLSTSAMYALSLLTLYFFVRHVASRSSAREGRLS